MTHQAVSRVTKTPFWHLLGTFQTPSNLLMFALWRASVGKQYLNMIIKMIFVNCYSINTVLAISRTNLTASRNPPRHPPDTIQSPWCRGHKLESLKKHPNRLDWVPNSLMDDTDKMNTEVIALYLGGVWRVFGWCLIDPGCYQDCVDGKTVGKQIIFNYCLSKLGLSGRKFNSQRQH